MAKLWTAQNTIEEALDLPEGRLTANFGFNVEVSVDTDAVVEAAEHLQKQNWEGRVATQAKLLVEAQKLGALEKYAPLATF